MHNLKTLLWPLSDNILLELDQGPSANNSRFTTEGQIIMASNAIRQGKACTKAAGTRKNEPCFGAMVP